MDKLCIVFISDNSFVIPTATAITSIIKNKDANTYCDIFIITTEIDELNLEKFNQFQSETININIINGNMEKFKGLHEHEENGYISATETALLKFDIPNLMPEFDKVLYLDGDIIVLKDLSELFNTKLENYYAAVVQDSGKLYFKNEYSTKYPNYFNSGVMLLNLKRMRDENITDKLVETKKELNDRKLMDQNILNTVFHKNIKLLDIKYNFLAVNLKRAKKHWKISEINQLYGSNYKNFQDIMNNSVILHYSSKDKPWKYFDASFSDIWRKYYDISPFKNNVLNLTKKPKNKISLHEHIFSIQKDKSNRRIIRFLGIKISVKIN